MRILAVSGSLQASSGNLALLRLAASTAPEGVEVVLFDGLRHLPHFDLDLEASGDTPPAVAAWRRAIAESDALIVACPEYGHSLPGALKNAVDWVIGSGELYRKIVAVTAAVPGPERGLGGLGALRQTLLAVDARILGGSPIARGPSFEADVAALVRAVVDEIGREEPGEGRLPEDGAPSVDADRPIGAVHLGEGRTRFRVWAPRASRVEVATLSGEASRRIPLAPEGGGYHAAVVDGAPPGTRYRYGIDGAVERPDPASRLQPEGVHGPSEVVDLGSPPRGPWPSHPIGSWVTYELHVGTFTEEGTFDAAAARLDDLVDLGITAVEIMPVAAFPGDRNWGYDGAYPFAVHASYGGPAGLRRFADACHARGLALIVDVVYNHLGPEGTYLASFGPYFTDRSLTPWGSAINLDGEGSDEVRRFFVESALYLVTEIGADGLRLDAVKALVDMSARPFLEDLADAVRRRGAALGRAIHLVGEGAGNDARLLQPAAGGGIGLDAVWSEDLHHALHALLTGERAGYYADYGRVEDLARAFRHGFAFGGEVSRYYGRRHGRPLGGVDRRRLVAYAQNHDEVGNRPAGDRLASLVSFQARKLVAAVTLLGPWSPLLFMGEEYGETAPFLYFVSHGDAALAARVHESRRAELAAFGFAGEPFDPRAEETFERSRIRWARREEGDHRLLLACYKELLRLRRALPALAGGRTHATAFEAEKVLLVTRGRFGAEAALVFAFGDRAVARALPLPAGRWTLAFDSTEARWGGGGGSWPREITSDGIVERTIAPESAALLVRG